MSKSGWQRHFPGGTVARTPCERLTDPRGICVLQDILGGGLGIRKACGCRYEMRDPDQPERDGFDLGDFLRSTLIGGLMGGLSGVAFFGVGKAVEVLKGSLSGGSTGGSDVLETVSKTNPFELQPTHSQTLSKNKMNALMDNIKINGIQEPIKYVEYNGQMYVVDGYHRLLAAKKLGLTEISVEKVDLPYAGYNTIDDLLWFE